MGEKGFTLIELLIVVVIIGILASIAIPRPGENRERAYVAAMQSDLRQLQMAQEMFFQDNVFTYAEGTLSADDRIAGLSAGVSEGVTIEVTSANGGRSWFATASHRATGRTCDVYVGNDPGAASPVSHANRPGVIACGEE